jgi:uncharacterized membrane protein YeaQ/YmgE (transglycosylase-associated protein family)
VLRSAGPTGSGTRGGPVAIIGFIVFGLVVGAVARLIIPGHQDISLVMTLVLGVIGSLIGGVVANALGTGDMWELNILGSIVAFISAAVLILIGERTGLLGGGDRRHHI